MVSTTVGYTGGELELHQRIERLLSPLVGGRHLGRGVGHVEADHVGDVEAGDVGMSYNYNKSRVNLDLKFPTKIVTLQLC